MTDDKKFHVNDAPLPETDTELETDALEELLDQHAQWLEYELRGAWRAGYEYVHLYRETAAETIQSGRDQFTVKQAVWPTDREEPTQIDGYQYETTYLVGELDPETVRQHLHR